MTTEITIVKFFNQLGLGTFVDSLTNGGSNITFLAVLMVVVVVAILFYDKKNGKTIAMTLLLALIINFAITDGLFKNMLINFDLLPFRDRPFVSYPSEIIAIGRQFTDASFPSGHMTAILAVFTVIVYYYRRWWWPISLFIIFLAFSRLHLGMHYPSDVLAGMVFGIIYGALSIWGVRFVETLRYKKKRKMTSS